MTAITTKSRQMRLDNCALNTPKRVQIAGNLRENACKDREAATPADAANAGLENNGKIRQIHPNTKLLGKYRFKKFDNGHFRPISRQHEKISHSFLRMIKRA